MFRRALVPAAVLLLVTSCSGRANDLDTYYDDPTAEVTTEPAAQAAPVPATTAATTAATTTTTTTTPAVDPAGALLGPLDLADEGVETASYVADAPLDCAPETGAAWTYPSGSTLEQTVHVLPDAAERVARMRAEGTCLTPTRSAGPELGEIGDDRYSWCVADAEVRACGAAVAKGGLLTVIVVEAGTADRAGAAITRIAPLAAAALDRV